MAQNEHKTNLIDGGIESRTMTVFALGGSGIRTVEPLLVLCGLGLGPRRLKLLLIDPDTTNAAVTRARTLIDEYRETRAAIAKAGEPTSYFRTEVIDAIGDTLMWSPIADDEHRSDPSFSARVDASLMRNTGAAPLSTIFDMLFAEKVRDMDLNLGFRGIPSIGTVFMNRLRDQQFFRHLLTEAQVDAESVFFSVGSIFGGTGAAALPVVGRALTEPIRGEAGEEDVPPVPRQRVGAALLLPYFTLPVAEAREAPDGGPRPDALLFAQNAAAAFPTYLSADARYGAMYVLGDGNPRQQTANEVGGEKQANMAHYIELFAALASLDFVARGGETATQLPMYRGSAVGSTNVAWSDLPISTDSIKRLMGGVVAAHTFLNVFRPDGDSRPDLESLLHGATWMQVLGIQSSHLRTNSATFDHLGKFFEHVWNWLNELRSSTPALELTGSQERRASAVPVADVIAGRGVGGGKSRSAPEFEVFRYWNNAAHRRRGASVAGFVEVMREASEAYASAKFGETIKQQVTT